MAYQETDNGTVTSNNSPAKGQARGNVVETSSEKITLKLQRKNN